METNDLIQALVRDASPVRRLRHPMTRAAFWFAISLPYVAGFVLVYYLTGNVVSLSLDPAFVIEQFATVATAATAAIAAFCCIVPGRDRRIGLLPLLPLAVWLASVGKACADSWLSLGGSGLSLGVGWECLPPSALIGVFPAVVMIVMLRRGAPLFPRSTVILGALATAALGNLGLRLFHVGDVTVMMLLWHLGAVALLLALASLFGPRMIAWRHVRVDGALIA